jgi:hypothetical protein
MNDINEYDSLLHMLNQISLSIFVRGMYLQKLGMRTLQEIQQWSTINSQEKAAHQPKRYPQATGLNGQSYLQVVASSVYHDGS